MKNARYLATLFTSLFGSTLLLSAADRFWTNAAGGNFTNTINWFANTVPGVADNANFTNNASYQVTNSVTRTNANAFFNAGSGTVTQAIGSSVAWLLTNNYVIGQNAGFTANVTHASGTLLVTNAAGNAALEVRRGTNRLNGGVINVDNLLMTNTAGKFEFNGGTLITRGGSISNIDNFTVGTDGGTPAIWAARAGDDVMIGLSLFIGENVPGSQLLITNGGRVINDQGIVGLSTNGNMAIVAGSGSVWSNRTTLRIGFSSSFNLLMITNGGFVGRSQGVIGDGVGANSNTVVVAGSGSVWTNGGIFDVGNGGNFNLLVVSNAGKVLTGSGSLASIGDNSSASGLLVVSGAGSVWSNSSSVSVGRSGDLNQLVVSNAGKVFSLGGSIGSLSGANSNSAVINGASSIWSNSSTLNVGASGSFNELTVSNSGTVFATALTVGANSTSTNNRSLLDGGTLRVTNATQDAALDIRRGTNQLNNNGLIEADQLVMTNALGRFEFNGGTFNVRTSLVANAQTFFVGNGVSPATNNLVGNGTHSFSNGLTLRANGWLIGNGSITGLVTVLSGATLAPGTSVGKIILSNSPTFLGTNLMEISKTSSFLTNDQVRVAGALTYGGTLTVTDIGPDALGLGDRFVLFDATSYAGSFSSTNLPLLPFGLVWTNKLLTDGSIEVVATPPADRFWTNALGGTYQVAANWLGNVVPLAQDNANFTNKATYQVNWTADAAAANALFNSSNATVTEAVGNFSWLLTNSYVIGQNANSTTSVTHASGILNVTNTAGDARLIVGQNGRGTFILSGANATVVADQLWVTNNGTGFTNSTLTLDNGTLTTFHGSTITQSSDFFIGINSGDTAVWNILGGTNTLQLPSAEPIALGVFAGSTGSVVVAGAATVWTNGGVFEVGLGGLGLFSVTNGAKVYSSRASIGSGTSSNLALVGGGSLWSMPGPLTVGGNVSAANSLTVSNISTVTASNVTLGATSSSSNNQVTVNGAGSLLTNAGVMTLGPGAGNRLQVTGGGQVLGGSASLGSAASSSNNLVVVDGVSSVFRTLSPSGTDLEIGDAGSFNRLIVTNGGQASSRFAILGVTATSSNNSAMVVGSGSVWSNASTLRVGSSGSQNRLDVSSGGQVLADDLDLGDLSGSSNNTLIVSDATSALGVLGSLSVGGSGVSNSLLVTNGGTITSGYADIGAFTAGRGNIAVVTGPNSRWLVTSNNFWFMIGQDGSSNSMSVLAGGSVGCSPTLYVGRNATAGTNTLFLSDPGSFWTNASSVLVGSQGFGNQLIISNGAVMLASSSVIGAQTNAYANQVLVTGSASLWSNSFTLTVGDAGSNNFLLVTNGARVVAENGYVGSTSESVSNVAWLTGSGSVWSNRSSLSLQGHGNRLVVTNGALAAAATAIYAGSFDTNNELLVTGTGSRLASGRDLAVGFYGPSNRLIIANGGLATCVTGYVGTAVSGNSALVTGAGSMWSNSSSLLIGDNGGDQNSLTVSNGATVAASIIKIGADPSSQNNTLAVEGGNLVGTSGGEITLVLVQGSASSLNLNAGTVTANRLVITNFASMAFNGGTLNVRTSAVSYAGTSVVGNGVSAATMNLVGNGTHSFAGGLAITNNGWLIGNGTISGPFTVWSGGTLAPGASIGKIILNSSPTLLGTNLMEISKNGSVLTNDQIQVGGPLTYGGTLTVTDIGPDTLVLGNRFVLFNASSYAGAFSSTNLPPLPSDLAWTNKLLVDGSIEVVNATPTDRFWTNGLGGTYQVAGNWLGNVVPNIFDNVNFTNNANYQVAWNADAAAANAFFNANSGTVTQAIGAIGSFSWLLTNSYILGQNPGTLASVTHSNGTLRVTNSAGTALLDIRRGTNRLNGGVIEADLLLLTNTAGVFQFAGGTLITRGASISNNLPFEVGRGGSTPAIWVARAGADVMLSSNLDLGITASGCQLLITNGGRIFNAGGTLGNNGASNKVLVAGPGSLWSNRASLIVGQLDDFNEVAVSNGGALFSSGGSIGSASVANGVIITGSGSIWSNSSTLNVGSSGSSNQLSVSNGGTVFATACTIGANNTSTNNQSVVDGGTLRVTNFAHTAAFDIRRGTNQLNNTGVIETDVLRLTNALGSFQFNGGTLNVRTSTVANAQTFLVGNGVSAATLNLVGNGRHSFSNGLTLSANASLMGNGAITGIVTVLSGATLAPGTSVGKIVLSNSPSLGGALVMEISKNGSVRTNDQIQVIGALTYGGALTVTSIGPDGPVVGDRFQLFNAGSYTGAFSSANLPSLASGLAWVNKLGLDGSIEVSTRDTFGYESSPASFAFVDITGTGTRVLTNADTTPASAPLGFSFNFYGRNYTNVVFNPMGLITFGGTNNIPTPNVNLGSNAPFGNFPTIAVLWDDWVTLTNGNPGADAVYYQTLGVPGDRRFILQWSNVFHFAASPNGVTFEAILFETNGNILCQYLDAVCGNTNDNGASATVGIRDTDGHLNGKNLQWSFNSGVIANGEAILFATNATDPIITVQPQDRTNVTGTTATFSVTAQGSGSLSYRWQTNGVNLSDFGNVSGAATTTLTITNVTSSNALRYTVAVTNAAGKAVSAVATLTVLTPPSITSQPQSETVYVDQNAGFGVVADGTSPLSYQWRTNSVEIPGATNSLYIVSSAQTNDNGVSFTVVVTNEAGSVTSDPAILTVSPLPYITSDPQSQSILAGDNAFFSVSAAGPGPLSYQWQFNGGNISGATASSYTRTNAQSSDEGGYSVVITNGFGSVTSIVAILTIIQPVITSDPSLPVLYARGGRYTNDFVQYLTASANLYQLRNVQIRALPPVTRSTNGLDETETFNASFVAELSVNGGSFSPIHSTATISTITYNKAASTTGTFPAELLQLDVNFVSFMLRESPAQASAGQTTITNIGGGLYRIDSFFDVFTELSDDGGANWTLGSFARLELAVVVPPQITSITSNPTNASIQITAQGDFFQSYALQAATNLNPVINWLRLRTNTTDAGGLVQFTNAPAFPQRFYRLVVP